MALNDTHKELNLGALDHHNKLRACHGAPKLTLDWDLAKSAQAYAEKLAKANAFAHSDSQGQYGENLASSFNSRPGYVFCGEAATQNWYDEIKDYKFGQENQVMHKIGHFSQVVWKGTKTAGFGRAQSKSGNFIIVGQYKPPGNFMGEFVNNVLQPSGQVPRYEEPKLNSTAAQPSKTKETSAPKSTTSKTSSDVKPTIGPKDKGDVLLKTSTKSQVKDGKKTVEVTETYKKPDGSTYELKKTTISK